MDLHNYKRRLERTLDLIKKSEDITEHNKEILFKFRDYCSCQNISYGKTDAYMFYSKKFTIWMKKDLELVTKDDIMGFISQLNQDDNYSPETKVSFKVMIRKLYKMIRNVKGKKDFPPEVSWINTTSPKNQDMLPEQLLTKKKLKELFKQQTIQEIRLTLQHYLNLVVGLARLG